MGVGAQAGAISHSLTIGMKMMRMEKMMRMIVMKNQAVIEEVNDRDLEKLVEENDFVAVAWFQMIKILGQELFT